MILNGLEMNRDHSVVFDPASVTIKLNIRCEKKERSRMTHNFIFLMNGDDIFQEGKEKNMISSVWNKSFAAIDFQVAIVSDSVSLVVFRRGVHVGE